MLSQRSSAKSRGRKADATASSNSPATQKLQPYEFSGRKEAGAMNSTDAGHEGRSYERALSIVDGLKPIKPVAAVVDAALLAVKPLDLLPGNNTPPAPMDCKLRGKGLRDRRKTSRSFCMVCQMWFGNLRGASFHRQHRCTKVCALWRVLVRSTSPQDAQNSRRRRKRLWSNAVRKRVQCTTGHCVSHNGQRQVQGYDEK